MSTINEIHQVVIEYQSHSWDKKTIVLVEDEGCQLKPLLTRYGMKSAISNYSAVEMACQFRASLTVRGELTLNGRLVTPEQYLRHWRKLVPIKPTDLLPSYGIKLVAECHFDMAAERKNPWHSTGAASSITGFNEFESKYHLQISGEIGRFDMGNEEQANDFMHFLRNQAYSKETKDYPSTYEILVGTDQIVETSASEQLFMPLQAKQIQSQHSLF